MKTAVIVQARLSSTRLPAKVLLPLPTGRTVLEEVLHRCKQIEGVDVVVAAVSDMPASDVIAEYAERELCTVRWDELDAGDAALRGHCVVRGNESDVLARHAKAACAVDADIVMRVTSDCPLLSPVLCSEMLDFFKRSDIEYLSNAYPVREVPHGWDCEIFTRAALVAANASATDPHDREHVTPYLQRHNKLAVWKCMDDRSHLRWTLDTIEDFVTITKVFNDAREHQLAA